MLVCIASSFVGTDTFFRWRRNIVKNLKPNPNPLEDTNLISFRLVAGRIYPLCR